MTQQDHLNLAQDYFKRARICADKQVRDRLVELAKDHLTYYYELLELEDKQNAK